MPIEIDRQESPSLGQSLSELFHLLTGVSPAFSPRKKVSSALEDVLSGFGLFAQRPQVVVEVGRLAQLHFLFQCAPEDIICLQVPEFGEKGPSHLGRIHAKRGGEYRQNPEGDSNFALTHHDEVMVKLLDRDRDEAHGYRKVADGNEEQHVSNNTCHDTVRLDLRQNVSSHFEQILVVAGTGTTSAKMEFNRSLHHLYHTCVKKSTLGGV